MKIINFLTVENITTIYIWHLTMSNNIYIYTYMYVQQIYMLVSYRLNIFYCNITDVIINDIHS